MSYYYVLGHSNNPIVKEYYEKYFQKLREMFRNLDFSWDIKRDFFKLTEERQKHFLSKADILTLIHYIGEFWRIELTTQLEKEFQYFLDGQEDKCTYSLGNTIPWTNIKLTIFDNNPQNDKSNHPNHKAWTMITWWERSEEEWLWVYKKSLTLLKDVNPEFYNELNFIIQKIVPFGTSKRVHNSCSLRESIGVLYLWYTIDQDQPELNILEAIIHESSHNKLNLIMQSQKLILNDKTLKYYSPYRPDARHIYGVYLWVHAIVPTIHTMIQAVEKWYVTETWWLEKILLYHLKNKIGMKVLRKYAKCSELWYTIMDELDEVMKLCDSMVAKSVKFKGVNIQNVQIQAKNHFLEVQKNYRHLEY